MSSSSSKTLTVAGTNIPRFTALARGFSVTKQQPGLFTKNVHGKRLGQAKLLCGVEKHNYGRFALQSIVNIHKSALKMLNR